MQSVDFLKNLWRWKCGLPEEEEKPKLNISELRKTEWSNEFEELMRNRLVMGAFRYGRLKAGNKIKYKRIKSIIRRVELFNETGNLEFLVDIANLAMCEFIECHHPKKHFSSIDDGEHVTF